MSSNISIIRICQQCGKEFEARTTVTRFCGEPCANKAYKIKKRQKKIEASNAETQQVREEPFEVAKTKDVLTVKDAAFLLTCSVRTIYAMIEAGRLKAINLSKRKTRISRAELDHIFSNPDLMIVPKEKETKAPKTLEVSDCYHISEVEAKYSIPHKTLYAILKRNNVEKLKEGKLTYVPKKVVDNLLRDRLN